MTHADSNPPEPQSEDEPAAPAAMSVDQLTQAFAQLMGEEPPAEDRSPEQIAGRSEAAVDSVGADAALQDDDHEDDGNVTPSAILEALLFVGHPQNEPLTNRQMASYLRGVSPQEVDAMIEQLNEQYMAQNAAYTIVSVGAGYRMTLREEFARLRESFYGRVREAKLSQAAVDLLAIVAYHQPISREEVDRLRGQPSGGTLSQLVRRQLLQVEYTQEKPRRKIYRTSERFLDLFGLESLDDLPSHEDF